MAAAGSKIVRVQFAAADQAPPPPAAAAAAAAASAVPKAPEAHA